jgi:homoserine O-acetyltransferase/O-succinyltransferase
MCGTRLAFHLKRRDLWRVSVHMTTSVKAPLQGPMQGVTAVPATANEGVLTIAGPLPLHFGGALEHVRIAWRLYAAQEPNAPVVAALGGISAGRKVFAEAGSDTVGWWNGVVGPGCPLDARQYAVLGFDFLGGSGDSTGPSPGDRSFPSISAFDQAEVLHRLIAGLGIKRLHAIVGASYGGMVALAFAERFAAEVSRIVSISAADRAHPMSTAWRSVQRAIVRYASARGEGSEGLKLARALAMATYRSPAEFAARFKGEPQRGANGFTFPVEAYLFARGDAYAQRYVPEAFVCLSESIDLHQVTPETIRVPTTLIGVLEDQLVPIADMRSLSRRLAAPCRLVELSSTYGHDAFLKEVEALRPILAQALGSGSDAAAQASR